MDTITPIQTVYNGYRFRSRLEARWAVFFDAIGMKYEYEPEGYDLGDGVRYLPDFYLPDYNCFAEVKANEPTEAELDKMSRLVLLTEEHNDSSQVYYNYLLSAKGIFLIGTPDHKNDNQIILVKPAYKYDNLNEEIKKYFEMAIHDCNVMIFISIAKDMDRRTDFSSCINALEKNMQKRDDWDDDEIEFMINYLKHKLKENNIIQSPVRHSRHGLISIHRGILRHAHERSFRIIDEITVLGCTKARQARFEHGETPVPGK
jgi:hypothetical protein